MLSGFSPSITLGVQGRTHRDEHGSMLCDLTGLSALTALRVTPNDCTAGLFALFQSACSGHVEMQSIYGLGHGCRALAGFAYSENARL